MKRLNIIKIISHRSMMLNEQTLNLKLYSKESGIVDLITVERCASELLLLTIKYDPKDIYNFNFMKQLCFIF
jgi:hypothetical protein